MNRGKQGEETERLGERQRDPGIHHSAKITQVHSTTSRQCTANSSQKGPLVCVAACSGGASLGSTTTAAHPSATVPQSSACAAGHRHAGPDTSSTCFLTQTYHKYTCSTAGVAAVPTRLTTRFCAAQQQHRFLPCVTAQRMSHAKRLQLSHGFGGFATPPPPLPP
jgi:hypothetical protein